MAKLSCRRGNKILLSFFIFNVEANTRNIVSLCNQHTFLSPHCVHFFFMGKMDKNLIKGFYFVLEIEKQSNINVSLSNL